jgi:acyl transferase domain-containing protein/NAD(P)H-dependent flavin oxidoreductase YrpB (nitropropane dioxygenase family)/NAD(P)-dependent dehydrogenase (short-subunit alcohol dehydrogenase family)
VRLSVRAGEAGDSDWGAMTLLPESMLAVSPFDRPDAQLVAAVCRAGATGVLDLGRDRAEAVRALAELAGACPSGFGVRIQAAADLDGLELPEGARLVVVDAGMPVEPWASEGSRRVLVQVTSLDEARAAAATGADGLIAKGAESGGRTGEETSFVLLQRLVAAGVDRPIWVQGGVGLRTAAACIAGGAAGVVLDSQLALVKESSLPEALERALSVMDGSETQVVGGYRVYVRPGLPSADLETTSSVADRLGADLEQGIVGAGQDAAFARPLAERFVTAGGVVRALERSISDQIRAARAAQPLASGSPFAAEHGIRYPIAQGPMTRVSDRAEFADAVSRGGGLPFLALALMPGPEVRSLLEETAERLGDRSWGVGILGFVPQEIREEQLAVIREVRPPYALIAGGLPDQARPLEEEGIDTYLHVPSPGLLDLFLRQGARRFVFEGRECGGHVGPRTSFVLWEQQIERLLAHDAPAELCVLFAGGIHDARSAAMVAALAAPLAARGAKVGVLMGTAYLFTEEAVEAGAIQHAFQEAAQSCAHTVLLDTAPGHSTRCAETDYVRAFIAERERLQGEGLPADEIWVALEQLNLGRLRIASKGLRREGPELVSVDADTQRREGMVMLGQVAALRESLTTVADLHRTVSEGSVEALANVALPEPDTAERTGVDVAIVGMAGILPGAGDLDAFWSNIVRGVNSITEVSKERWDPDIYFDPDSHDGHHTPSKWGGFIDPVAFDPLAYGIPPLSLAAIEPVQLLALEVTKRALDDAGYGERDFDRGRASVIFGAEAGTDLASGYGFRSMWPQYAGPLPKELDEVLPTPTEDSFAGVLSNVISGRIANRLDLGGVNYTVDAACASSLAAVDLAVKELATGTSDLVVCGGADLHNGISDFLMFASVHALSRQGQCKTFDASADGITLGEGVVAVILKRLEDAERDGDRIYAVIKGVGGGSDGKSLGLTAPRREGQVRTLARAYRAAGFSPGEVTLVEAHGTGTVVGDRTELETLNEVFVSAGADPASCTLGSVKSQIGHTKCAAGVAGLIKVALALHHRVLPPTMNIENPNPAWDAETSPFTLNAQARPWSEAERRGAVSAFGFGGTNFHAVLAEHENEEAESGLPLWPAELFLFRGDDREAAGARIDLLQGLLEDGDEWRLRDLARSISAGEGPVQAAVVARDLDDLRTKLAKARAFTSDPAGVLLAGDVTAGDEGKVAFLFPGQGSQRVGMLGELFIAFPELQRFLSAGGRFARLMFPPTAWSDEEREAQRAALTDTRAAQPALGIADLATASLLEAVGVTPDLVAGHSYGELVALCVAGALSESDLLHLSEARAECILAAADDAGGDPGTMAAVAASPEEIESHLDGLAGFDGLVIANENAPDQSVISGPTSSVEKAVEALTAAGVSATRIPVACAFHSPLVASASDRFAAELERVDFADCSLPVYSNTTADVYPSEPGAIRGLLARHVAMPVRFASEIEAMYEAGTRIFVEAGPGRVLTGLVSRILGDRPHIAVSCEEAGPSGLTRFLLTLGQLAVAGVPVDIEQLYAGRGAKVLDLVDPPSASPSPTSWWVNGQRAWPVQGEPPPHAMLPVTKPVVGALGGPGTAGAAGEAATREQIVLEYLRMTRELVASQRQIVLGYLGQAGQELLVEPVAVPTPAEPVPAAQPQPAEAVEPAATTVTPQEALLEIVSERTGYPIEMLDLDLDLEADLSIDSIKRIEILGALGERLGVGPGGDADGGQLPEGLARVKTLRAILEWIEEAAGTLGAPQLEPEPVETLQQTVATSENGGAAADGGVPVPERIVRYLLAVEPAGPPEANGNVVEGKQVLLVDDGRGVAEALARKIEGRGGTARVIGQGDAVSASDALVDLSPLGEAWHPPDDVKGLFARARKVLLTSETADVIVAVPLGGALGRAPNGTTSGAGGVGGLIKSLAKEWPERNVRAVQLTPGDDPEVLASHVLDELLADDSLREVGYVDGLRNVLRPTPAEHGANGRAPGLELDELSVVLVTGGARGITSHVARAVARRFRCRLEIVGRSPLPDGEEDEDIREAGDLPAIRQVLLARGELHGPAEIEATAARILADREIRSTLAALAEAGSEVAYHAVDVRDCPAFGALIDDIYARHGRLDGVIHGAGVIEDKLARDKTGDSFERVYDTKVKGAVTVAEKLREEVRFVAFFSSVSGAFGNRGQSDYAAANDFLDKLAIALNTTLPGRVVSINWGPWSNDGMVSDELARAYAQQGVGLIDPSEGVESFLAELEYGAEDDSQVILMRADPSRLL